MNNPRTTIAMHGSWTIRYYMSGEWDAADTAGPGLTPLLTSLVDVIGFLRRAPVEAAIAGSSWSAPSGPDGDGNAGRSPSDW